MYNGENDETMAPVYVSEEGSIKDNDVRPSSATDSLGRHPLQQQEFFQLQNSACSSLHVWEGSSGTISTLWGIHSLCSLTD